MVKLFPVALMIVSVPFLSIAHAASRSDFFCFDAPIAPAVVYKLIIKGCGSGQSDSQEDICGLSANCAYVTEEIKKAAKKEYGKEFAALTPSEKRSFLRESELVEFFPSNLTCKAAMTQDGPVCPLPEDCKNGDVLYRVKPAQMDQDKYSTVQQRYLKGKSQIFQVSPGAGVAK